MQPTLWNFDRVAAQDPERAKTLRVAPSLLEISQQVVAALRRALINRAIRIGFDESGEGKRAIIQFHLGQQLFDWLFNGHTGYRAQFRIDWKTGHAYNKQLVEMLRDELARALEREIEVRRLNAAFEDIGTERVPRSRILESLDPEPSKVWFCRKLIGLGGEVVSLLVDISGPRLVFDEYESWAAPYADEEAAWLDLKGVFLAKSGPFQIKDPIQRAKDLQRLGSA